MAIIQACGIAGWGLVAAVLAALVVARVRDPGGRRVANPLIRGTGR